VKTPPTVTLALSHLNPAEGIYLRGKTYWLNHYPQGKRARVTLGTPDYGTAVKNAALIHKKIISPKGEGVLRTAQIYTEEAVRMGTMAPGSAYELHRVLKGFLLFANVATLEDIKPHVLQKYFDKLTTQVKPASWASYAGRLSGFFGAMLQSRRITANPMLQVRLPKFNQAAHARSNTVKAQKAIELINECSDLRLRFVLVAGFLMGMRKNEIIQCQWGWFDYANKVCSIPLWARKRAKAANPPMIEGVFDILKELKAALPKAPAPTDYILEPQTPQGRARYRWDFNKPFNEYQKSKGCAFTAHDMRRSFATNLVQAGISLEVISGWVGDTVRTLEMHYSKLNQYDARAERLMGKK